MALRRALVQTVVLPDAVPPVQPMTKGRFRVLSISSSAWLVAGTSRLIGLMPAGSSSENAAVGPTGECCSSIPKEVAELSTTPPVGERGGLGNEESLGFGDDDFGMATDTDFGAKCPSALTGIVGSKVVDPAASFPSRTVP